MAQKPPITAPVLVTTESGEDHWLGVSFIPSTDLGSNEPITPTREVDFISPYKHHLNALKVNLSNLLARDGVPRDQQQKVEYACPRVVLFGELPDRVSLPIKLSTTEQRSWELAYLLSCLSAADLGVWNSNCEYWATGEVNGEEISAEGKSLLEKKEFVFNLGGRGHFFFPKENSTDERIPINKTVTEITTITQLFSATASPFNQRRLDSFRFSEIGTPGCLVHYLKPATFDTRNNIENDLIQILKDRGKQLVLVSSPIGWGKTTLLARALAHYALPVYVTDLENVLTSHETVGCLLKGFRITYDDTLDIDGNLGNVARELNAKLPPQTLLVFLNCSLNANNRPSTEVQGIINVLLRSGYRCVVELWDMTGWQQREFHDERTEKIMNRRIPRLSDAEVRNWLAIREFYDDEIVSAFDLLDGHPWGISATISKIEEDRNDDLPVDSQVVLNAAIEWERDPKILSYINRVEEFSDRKLPYKIIEWFALFWTQELPDSVIKSEFPEYEKQLRFGVKIGLLTYTGIGYKARGWFHLFCIEKFKQSGMQQGGLTIDWSQLESIDAAEYGSIQRHLVEIAAEVPQARHAIMRLAMTVPEAVNKDAQLISEYVPTVAPETLAVVTIEISDITEAIWALEQSCRLGLFQQAEDQWIKITDIEQEDPLVRALEENWIALRTLGRSYRVLSRKAGPNSTRALRALNILQKLQISEPGHRSHIANTALNIADDLMSAGQLNDAREATALASEMITELQEPIQYDYRYDSWLELNYLLYKTQYVQSPRSAEAQIHLQKVLEVIEKALSINFREYRWQRRYFRYISEAAEFADDYLTVNESLLKTIFEFDPSTSLEDFLTSRFENLFSTNSNLNSVDKVLLRLANNVWERSNIRNNPPETRLDFFALHCGLILRKKRAFAVALTLLDNAWKIETNESELYSSEYLRLTILCLKLAGRVKGHHNDQLIKALRTIRRPRIKELTKSLPDYVDRSFWNAYLTFRVRLFTWDSKDQDIAPILVLESQKRLNSIFNSALVAQPKDAARILSLKYDFYKKIWQLGLEKQRESKKNRRNSHEKMEASTPLEKEGVIREFEKLCPEDPLTWRYKARFYRYIWKLKDACGAAERAYMLARYARSRRENFLLLANYLITWVFIPEALRTAKTPIPDQATISKLNEVASELIARWPDYVELSVFSEGYEGGTALWEKAVKDVENRLGDPEEFWDRVTNDAFVDEPKDSIEDALSDLTDRDVMSLLSIGLRWASQRADFDKQLRLRLIEAAFRCEWAAQQWKRGSGIKITIIDDYKIASIITLALMESADGRLFGRDNYPATSRTRGRVMSWKEAAATRLSNAKSSAIGEFKEHVDEIWNRFKQYYQ